MGHNYECNIIDCEYNLDGHCVNCGDVWSLNDPDCMSYEPKWDGGDADATNHVSCN